MHFSGIFWSAIIPLKNALPQALKISNEPDSSNYLKN